MVYKSGQIFLMFCQSTRVTDGQTDGRTEISSPYRGCITCSAVKMMIRRRQRRNIEHCYMHAFRTYI